MNRNLIRIQKSRGDVIPLDLRIKRELDQLANKVQLRRNLLLSLKPPIKLDKIDIKQLFTHERKPIFSMRDREQIRSIYDMIEQKTSEESKNRFEFNLRNTISKSTYHTSIGGKEEHCPKSTKRDFLAKTEKTSYSIHLTSIQEPKHNLMDINQQLQMIANLKQTSKDAPFAPRTNRKAYSINNFIRTRYLRTNNNPKDPKSSHLTKKQSEINPWEEPNDTEDDNFLQN